MTQAEQEAFKAFVAEKCKEALAPLYAELEEIRASYNELKDEPTQTKQVPTPQLDPEEVREAEFKKNLQEMKEMLIKSGRIKA
jgi:hypothetical protein